MRSSAQTILLTGVNGFLGNYLTPVLLQQGYIVYGIGKGICRLSLNNKHFFYFDIDLTDHKTLHALFETVHPDIIIHAAANSKPDDCELNRESAFTTNVQTTDTLLKIATTIRSRFIYISTDFVFDGISGLYKEDDDCNAINYYGKTKRLSESLVAQYGFHSAIIRTVLVYGKPLTGRQNILSIIFDKLNKKEPVRLVDDQFRTPTYIHDLVWGIKTILLKNKTGFWHLSGDLPLLSPFQMGLKLAEIYQLDATLLLPVNHTTFNEVALRPRTTGLNIQKAKTELGYCPTPFENAVKEIFKK